MNEIFKHRDPDALTTLFVDRVDGVPNPGDAIQIGIGDRSGPAVHARLPHDAARQLALGILAVVGWPEPAEVGFGADNGPPRVQFHAEIGGQWLLTLAAREDDIRTMRLVTEGERIPGGDA